MEKHPEITLQRIRRAMEELQQQIWLDPRPLDVAVYQCAEPIAHDEAVAAPYTPVSVGYAWGPVWSTAWFRLRGQIPAEWAGAEVAMRVSTGTEALIWRAGAPAQGLDWARDAYMLTEQAGDAVEFFVEASGYPAHVTKDLPAETPFMLRQAALARFCRPAWDLYCDLSTLYHLTVSLPEDTPRRATLVAAMNEAVNIYRRGGEDALVAARAPLSVELAKPAAASAQTAFCCGHSHIDVAWKWPLRETKRKCARTFSSMLTYLAQYPEFTFTQSQPQLYAYVKEQYPALYARIKQAVAEGRWEPQGAMWVEADCNITGGESLVRQILHGTRFFREEFGVENTILWLPDVFGYSAAMPQILQECGIPYFMTQKISWNQFNKFPHHTFWWEGIDGTRVLTHFLPADTYNGDFSPQNLLKGERQFRDKGRTDSWLYLYGHGDGGGGVTPEMLERAARMRDLEGLPKVEMGLARDWFPQMAAEAHDLRTWAGELYLEYHRGTYTTQAKNKWENRRCEFLLHDAEFLAAVRPGGTYPAEALERAWKLVLLNQFHDIIPGSSIGWVYEDSARDYAEVHRITEAIIADSLGAFAAQVHTSDMRHPVMAWNTLSFPRSGVVSLPWEGTEGMVGLTPKSQPTRTQLVEEDGERRLLLEVADVPAMGYMVYDLLEGTIPEGLTPVVTDEVTAEPYVLENGLVRVELNAQGEVASFYDKQQEREIIAPGERGNRFQLFDDRPVNYDAWDIDPYFDEVGSDVATPATVTVLEAGPVRAALRVERPLTDRSSLVQIIRLEANSRRVDFDTHIAWHEDHKLLKVAFPVDLHTLAASYEIQYGHVERPTHRNTSWDVARFEVPAQKWADLSESDYGVALLNDGKYGYDIHGHVMRLTLLRAPKNPDPNADMGDHRFTYSLLPHRGNVENSGVALAGYDVNVPVYAQEVPVQNGALALSHSYFRLDKPNLIIESVKRAEDGDGIIVRLYEAFRRRGAGRLLVNGLATRVTRTDLLERDQEEMKLQGGAVHFNFRPFEIITLRLRGKA